MAKCKESIVNSRQELMTSSTITSTTMRRKAHFLKPSITTRHVFDDDDLLLPPHSLTSLLPSSSTLKPNFNAWRSPQQNWKLWVNKMSSLHGPTWKNIGIFDPIINSTFIFERNTDLVLALADKWCPGTNSFIFPWGEATITLEDVMLCLGYSVLGSPVFKPLEDSHKLKVIEAKLCNARKKLYTTAAKKANHVPWMLMFMDSGSEIEHEAFLVLWLSRYVFANCFESIVPSVFSIAVNLASGVRIALAPAVLASVYKDLTLLKSVMNGDTNGNGNVKLVSQLSLVQIWAWERFIDLQPNPNVIRKGETRLARWNQAKRNVDDVKLILDTSGETFCWRPYAKALKNWDFPKFYGEKNRWVVLDGDLDDEFLSFARCVRVSQLVGFDVDCIEQYLPHRVARQFGFDQDLPCCVARSNENHELAWRNFNKSIKGVKLYIPSRLFEADVTIRYLQWWKQFISALQNASVEIAQHQKCSSVKSMTTPKNSKATKKIDKLKGKKIIRNILNKDQKGNGITSKEGESCEGFKITPKKPTITQISPKRSEPRNSDDDDDDMTITELLKSTKEHGIIKRKTCSDDSPCQILPPSTVDCEGSGHKSSSQTETTPRLAGEREAVKIMELETREVDKVMQDQPTVHNISNKFEKADGITSNDHGGYSNGFKITLKRSEPRNSDDDDDDYDNMTISGLLKSTIKCDVKKQRTSQGDSLCQIQQSPSVDCEVSGTKTLSQTQIIPPSAGDSEAAKITEPETGLLDTVMPPQLTVGESNAEIHSSRVAADHENQSLVQNEVGDNDSSQVSASELKLRISNLEILFRKIRAKMDA